MNANIAPHSCGCDRMNNNCVENATRFFTALGNEFVEFPHNKFPEQLTQATHVLQVVLYSPKFTAVAWTISVGGGEASVIGPLSVSHLQCTTVTARISIPEYVADCVMKGTIRPDHVLGHQEVVLIGDIHQFQYLIPKVRLYAFAKVQSGSFRIFWLRA